MKMRLEYKGVQSQIIWWAPSTADARRGARWRRKARELTLWGALIHHDVPFLLDQS